MKNKLRDYFFDRLSMREEEEVQKYICANGRSQELDDSLRNLFDECLTASGQQNHRQSVIRKIYPFIIGAVIIVVIVIIVYSISFLYIFPGFFLVFFKFFRIFSGVSGP